MKGESRFSTSPRAPSFFQIEVQCLMKTLKGWRMEFSIFAGSKDAVAFQLFLCLHYLSPLLGTGFKAGIVDVCYKVFGIEIASFARFHFFLQSASV